MLSHRESFKRYIQSSYSVMASKQTSEIINIFCTPCPEYRKYWQRNQWTARNTTESERDALLKCCILRIIFMQSMANTQNMLIVVPRDLFDCLKESTQKKKNTLGETGCFLYWNNSIGIIQGSYSSLNKFLLWVSVTKV